MSVNENKNEEKKTEPVNPKDTKPVDDSTGKSKYKGNNPGGEASKKS